MDEEQAAFFMNMSSWIYIYEHRTKNRTDATWHECKASGPSRLFLLYVHLCVPIDKDRPTLFFVRIHEYILVDTVKIYDSSCSDAVTPVGWLALWHVSQ